MRDEPELRALLQRAGAFAPELLAARLARADPRRRLVICAMALIGSTETLLGVGELEYGDRGRGSAEAQAYVDEELAPGLHELLIKALHGRRQNRAA
jgi:hypothetical protein